MAGNEGKRPRIVQISLNHQPFFDQMYQPLLAKLYSKAVLQRVENAELAIHLLSGQPPPSAALITDEALTNPNNTHVWETILQYVSRGGIAVVMGLFSSFVKSLAVKPFFAKAGLPWESGSYTRTTLVLNQESVPSDLGSKLPTQYSQKASFIANVAPSDMWYCTDESSVVESRVFDPISANVPGETAVALASVGMGKLGYVGDVNAERESNAAILAMCGLW